MLLALCVSRAVDMVEPLRHKSVIFQRSIRLNREKIRIIIQRAIVLGTCVTMLSAKAYAASAAEVAQELANPNTALATLNVKLQFRSFKGDLPDADQQDSTTLLFQPSLPFPLDNGATVFFRPAIPIILDQSVPTLNDQAVLIDDLIDFENASGIGDTVFDLAYGRTTESGLVWATGIIASLPTATKKELGTDRWTLGPEALLAKLSKNYVIGTLTSHQWDIAGSGDAEINLTSMQLITTYLPGGGWNLGTSPTITYDHEADQWTIPLNFSFGKTVIWEGRPWKLGMEINYYVEQADAFGPEWFIGFSIGPVVENALAAWFK